MEYRKLGKSGLNVPVLSLGTGTFGGVTEMFERWGNTDVKEATRLIDICLEQGLNFFDTADVYSLGVSEEVLGAALRGRRNRALIATKGTFQMGDGLNDSGSSRAHLTSTLHDSLRRLGTDYVDVYFIHGFDSGTPIEETLSALDTFVRSGKVRYIGCSNYAAWQLMKALSISERRNFESYTIYQGYYSLIGRDYEQELMPLIRDQGLGLMVWSPLGWARLTGKIRRGQPIADGRIKAGGDVDSPPVSDEFLYNVVDCLDEIAARTGKSVSQIAINWLLQQDTVSNVVIGARNEKQLVENIGAVGWSLSEEDLAALDAVSRQPLLYPHWVGQR